MHISTQRLAISCLVLLPWMAGCGAEASEDNRPEAKSLGEPIYSGIVDNLARGRVEVVMLNTPFGQSPKPGIPKDGWCTATLIGSRYILTASHCPNWLFTPSEAGGHIVLTNLDGSQGPQIEVERAWSFGTGYGFHDVALARLARAVTDPELHGATIAQISTIGATNGNQITLVGYGCDNNATPPRGFGTKARITVNWPVPFHTACQGDSGGPVFLGSITGHEIAGVNSTDGAGGTGDAVHNKERIEQMIRSLENGLEPDTNRIGGNYGGATLSAGATAVTCRDLCTQEKDCLAFSYETATRTCSFKNRVVDSTPQFGIVSGLSMRTMSADRFGGDFTDYDSPNAETCQSDCARLNVCSAFNYNGGHCWLKSAVNGSTSCPTCTSGARKGIEKSTDRPGHTFNNQNPQDSAILCANLCVRTFACVAWAYNSTTKSCELKDRVTDPVAAGSNMSAGVRRGLDYMTERSGGDYKDADMADPDPTICQTRCALEDSCVAWSASRTHCWLKSTIPSKSTNNDRTSGLKGMDTWTY